MSFLAAQIPASAQIAVEVIQPVHQDVSQPLKDLGDIGDTREKHEIPKHNLPPKLPKSGTTDPVLQSAPLGPLAPATSNNFDGIGQGSYGFTVNSAPPDTNGAVGATQYVQWVNSSFAIFNKSTGGLISGPTAGNTVWQGFGGGCEANNDGDPILQYDKAANRWVLSQFSVTTTPYLQCFAISTTSDATGSYYRYSFQMPNFPDYPKIGVWPDAYYASFNMFSGNTFVGGRACAFDRAKMLTGAAATGQCFQLGASYGGLLPSDLDGLTPPPAGSPNFFVAYDVNALFLWKFHVDFTTPANTAFAGPASVPVAAFTAACNGGGTCIPQSGTSQQLDSLADRLMYRLAYRNFGDHEALVVYHSVVAGSSVGLRWYELRSPNTNPTVFQQGTYAPDANYRWLGSISMDKAGDMAMGYSVSSAAMHPSIRFTGRVPSDPLGSMETETNIIGGSGSQLSNLNRWGDYSSMSIDPVDDCTFWYTTEYLKSGGTFNWSTRIANFKFPSCGNPDFSIAATPASQTVTQGASTSYTVTATPSGGFTGSVTYSVSGLPTGGGAAFTPNPSATTSTMSVTTAGTTPVGTYSLTITGTSGSLIHTATVTLTVGDFSISASPPSQTIIQGASTTYTVASNPAGAFSVSYSVTGLPSGATGSFNPNPSTGNSTLTVATTGTTPPGTYSLTITGVSGSLSHTASVTLIVNAAPVPDFTMTVSPTSQTVSRAASTSFTVGVSPVNSFNGTVTFSVTGLPSRTSASFNPASVTGSGTSTLTITTSKKTSSGNYTLTVTGTSGGLSHKNQATLVVQ